MATLGAYFLSIVTHFVAIRRVVANWFGKQPANSVAQRMRQLSAKSDILVDRIDCCIRSAIVQHHIRLDQCLHINVRHSAGNLAGHPDGHIVLDARLSVAVECRLAAARVAVAGVLAGGRNVALEASAVGTRARLNGSFWESRGVGLLDIFLVRDRPDAVDPRAGTAMVRDLTQIFCLMNVLLRGGIRRA